MGSAYQELIGITRQQNLSGFLFYTNCKNEEVHKDFISQVCQRDKPDLGQDQQVRHLKRDGWYLAEDARPGLSPSRSL